MTEGPAIRMSPYNHIRLLRIRYVITYVLSLRGTNRRHTKIGGINRSGVDFCACRSDFRPRRSDFRMQEIEAACTKDHAAPILGHAAPIFVCKKSKQHVQKTMPLRF